MTTISHNQERSKVLQRLYLLRQNPELYKDLTNAELADLVRVVLLQTEAIAEMIKSGVHDGYTPKEGVDYLGRKEAEAIIHSALKSALVTYERQLGEKHGAIEQAVNKRLAELQNGKDGEPALFTDDILSDIASRARALVQLPDFSELITMEPEAIRDALELLQDEDKLSISSIHNLREELDAIRRETDHKTQAIGATIARRLGQIRDVDVEGATTGQVLTRKADGTFNFQTPTGGAGGITVETPPETPNGVTTAFTVTAEPQWMVADGTTYFANNGYTYAALTVTFTIAPSASVRAII